MAHIPHIAVQICSLPSLISASRFSSGPAFGPRRSPAGFRFVGIVPPTPRTYLPGR